MLVMLYRGARRGTPTHGAWPWCVGLVSVVSWDAILCLGWICAVRELYDEAMGYDELLRGGYTWELGDGVATEHTVG